MMGVSSWLNWCAWFTKYLMFMIVSVALMTLMFTVSIGTGSVVTAIDPSIFFAFLMLYAIASICFCFAVTVFFKKGNYTLLYYKLGITSCNSFESQSIKIGNDFCIQTQPVELAYDCIICALPRDKTNH